MRRKQDELNWQDEKVSDHCQALLVSYVKAFGGQQRSHKKHLSTQ